MLIENEFTVPAPVDQVWRYMNDFPQVARCMPGAEITVHVEPLAGERGAGHVPAAMIAEESRESPP